MLIEGLVALGSALEAWRRKSAMICWRSANLLSGVGHICAPRRDRPCGRIIPRSTRATTCSPVRRISLACRMSAKALTRQAHRRFAKVRSRRVSPAPVRAGEGSLTEPRAAVRPCLRERVLMPQSRRCRDEVATAQSGGGCVKTLKTQQGGELFSLLPFFRPRPQRYSSLD